MSNPLAIAAVTTTLRSLLDQEINTPLRLPLDNELVGTRVTVRAPDKARDSLTGHQLNLFLVQTSVNPALRNSELPGRSKPGERSFPPLPLNLIYLVTAYGKESQDPDLYSHRLIGRAMSILHDTPVLLPEQIRQATAADLPESDLHEQVELVRITPQPVSLEEQSKLWATFQAQYRISALYHVAVVLIDSIRPNRAALPVLRRGPEDQGASVLADPNPLPTLDAVLRTRRRPGLRPGDTLILRGRNLSGASPAVLLSNPRLDLSHELAPAPGGGADEQRVTLPPLPAVPPQPGDNPLVPEQWPAGLYTVALRVERDGRAQTSNELPFSMVPQITVLPPPAAPAGRTLVLISCATLIWPGQRVALLLNDREFRDPRRLDAADAAVAPAAKAARLEFDVTGLAPGEYVARLRVDGVDSVPLADGDDGAAFSFDPQQKVIIP